MSNKPEYKHLANGQEIWDKGFQAFTIYVMVSWTVLSILQNYQWWPDSWVVLSVWVAGLLHHINTSIISIVYHRWATHNAIEVNPKVEAVSDNFVQLTTGVCLEEWKPAHEVHHRYADRDKDPHSPKNDWLIWMFLDPFIRYSKRIEQLKKERIINARLANTPVQKIFFPLLTANAYMWTFWTMNALIAILVSYGLLKWATWTVNGLGHNHPKRRREFGDSYAQNVWVKSWWIKSIWLNFLTAGEHTHGNHHFRPKSADISLGWKDGAFDIGYFYIKVLEKLWLVKVKSNFGPDGKPLVKDWEVV